MQALSSNPPTTKKKNTQFLYYALKELKRCAVLPLLLLLQSISVSYLCRFLPEPKHLRVWGILSPFSSTFGLPSHGQLQVPMPQDLACFSVVLGALLKGREDGELMKPNPVLLLLAELFLLMDQKIKWHQHRSPDEPPSHGLQGHLTRLSYPRLSLVTGLEDTGCRVPLPVNRLKNRARAWGQQEREGALSTHLLGCECLVTNSKQRPQQQCRGLLSRQTAGDPWCCWEVVPGECPAGPQTLLDAGFDKGHRYSLAWFSFSPINLGQAKGKSVTGAWCGELG